MAILPDDIKELSNVDGSLQTIHKYIRYMREQLEFWGANRERDLKGMNTTIDSFESDVNSSLDNMTVAITGLDTALGTLTTYLSKLQEGTGYLKLPGGTLINYGTQQMTVAAGSSTNVDITFARQYNDTDYIVLAVNMYDYPSRLSCVGVPRTEAQFRLYASNTTSSIAITNSPVAWLAIGKV